MERRWRVRAVDADHVHARDHLVKALPISRLQTALNLGVDTPAVMVMHLHAKGRCTLGHGLTDPPHAQNAQTPTADPSPQQRCGGPTGPAAFLHDGHTLGHALRHPKDQRHGHISGIIGQYTRCVADQNAPLARGGHVNMVHPCAVVRDQFQLVTCLSDQRGINIVSHRRHQHIRRAHRVTQFGAGHRHIIQPQLYVKEFGQPDLDRIRQPSRDYNTQPFL